MAVEPPKVQLEEYYELFVPDTTKHRPCLCGYYRAIIKHDGGVVPCDAIKYPDDYERAGISIPNVLGDTSLEDAFYHTELFKVWRSATSEVVPFGCGSCKYWDLCRGYCRGLSLARYGKVTGLFGPPVECVRTVERGIRSTDG